MKILDLLYIEYLKFRDNSLVKLLLLFFTVLASTAIFVMKNMNKMPLPGGNTSIFTFPTVWEYQAYSGSWMSFIFLGFFGLYLVTSEISWKTMRQNVITGYSRFDFYIGKIMVAVIISIFATIVFYISTAIIGIIHQEKFDFDAVLASQDYVILRFFILTFAYIIFGMLMGFLFRKSGLAMFAYFSYILFIEPLFRWWLHYKLIDEGKTMLYYPMNGVEDLAPLPFFKYLESFSPVKGFNILLSYTEASIISIISVSVFLIAGYLLLTKRDI